MRIVGQWQQAIVIGASSGIGEAVARQLARAGTTVALVARRAEELERVRAAIVTQAGEGRARAYIHDVHDLEAIPGLFQEIARDLGGVDLVVYASGAMIPSTKKGYDTQRDVETIAVNLLGAIGWCNAAAERFTPLRTGTIVGISSVAGDRGRRNMTAYGVAKAGLTTYLESLRNRLGTKGVAVVTIKPGYVATPMTSGQDLPKIFPVIPAERAARQIIRAARRKQPVAYIPGLWRPVMALVRAIPSRIFRRLNV